MEDYRGQTDLQNGYVIENSTLFSVSRNGIIGRDSFDICRYYTPYVLPPGATGTSETVEILPNGTAGTVTPAQINQK